MCVCVCVCACVCVCEHACEEPQVRFSPYPYWKLTMKWCPCWCEFKARGAKVKVEDARSFSLVCKRGISTAASFVTKPNLTAVSHWQDFKLSNYTKHHDFSIQLWPVWHKMMFDACCTCKANTLPLANKIKCCWTLYNVMKLTTKIQNADIFFSTKIQLHKSV